jgi:hypothetical protein
MANNKGKATAAELATNLIAGIQKHLATGPMQVAGSTFTAAQVIAELQQLVVLRAAVDAARATATAKEGCRDWHHPDPHRGRRARREGVPRPHRRPRDCGHGDGRDDAADGLASGDDNKGKGRRLRKGGGPPFLLPAREVRFGK